MHKNIRKSDSLAHATVTFMESLKEMETLWNNDISDILKISPDVIALIKEIISSKGKSGFNKEKIMNMLTKLGELFNNMERINALMNDLLIEVDGLDFPLKTPRVLMKLNNEEEDLTQVIQNVVQNISKTMTFFESSKMDLELLESSLKSFETTYNEYSELITNYRELMNKLHIELDKEHKKARKYGDIV